MAWAHRYTSKLPVTAAHVLNDRVLPVFEEHGIRIRTILSDNGRESCGRPDRHPYELFLQLEGSRTPYAVFQAGTPHPRRSSRMAATSAPSIRRRCLGCHEPEALLV